MEKYLSDRLELCYTIYIPVYVCSEFVSGEWKNYLKLCRLSASDFYTNMIKEVGLMSPFEEDCVKNIVEKLKKYVK